MSNIEKNSSLKDVTIGVGILSWKSHKTLEKSLQSYEKVGFKELFDEVKIIFQEISPEDKALAEKYGYDYVGTDNNLGIQHGHKLIHDNLSTDYVIVLENDNPVIVDTKTLKERVLNSLKHLESGKIDVMRLRHRWNFGEGFSLEKYTEYYEIENLHDKYSSDKIQSSVFSSFTKKLKRIFRPEKALRIAGYSLYFEKEPEKIFPLYIKKIDDEIFSVSSNILTWTNQSAFLKRKFYGELIDYAYSNPSSRTSNSFQDLEKPLNVKWWRDQNYKIGVCEGVFTHNRFDDSWRKSHHAYNKSIIN
ncbi:hypothetical protein [Poseidonibacter sp.]|uniref:hypothetical protein n=1 Tax=Poseidonibacter sp. TaxID=2321188 RepID=UPI003C76412A